MRAVIVVLVVGLTLCAVATSANAQTEINQNEITLLPSVAENAAEFIPPDSHVPLLVDFAALADPTALQQGGSPRTVAFEYSDGYAVRRKIHVYASLATLPLFVTEVISARSSTTEMPLIRFARRIPRLLAALACCLV